MACGRPLFHINEPSCRWAGRQASTGRDEGSEGKEVFLLSVGRTFLHVHAVALVVVWEGETKNQITGWITAEPPYH